MSEGVPFNPHKPYGEVTPPYFGAVYEQVGTDGVSRLYTGQHRRVLPPGEKLQGDDIKEVAAPQPKPATARKRTQRKTTTKAAAPAAKKKSNGIDLRTWGRGELDIPFADVAKFIEKELDVVVDDEEAAAVAIVQAGLLEASEIGVV